MMGAAAQVAATFPSATTLVNDDNAIDTAFELYQQKQQKLTIKYTLCKGVVTQCVFMLDAGTQHTRAEIHTSMSSYHLFPVAFHGKNLNLFAVCHSNAPKDT